MSGTIRGWIPSACPKLKAKASLDGAVSTVRSATDDAVVARSERDELLRHCRKASQQMHAAARMATTRQEVSLGTAGIQGDGTVDDDTLVDVVRDLNLAAEELERVLISQCTGCLQNRSQSAPPIDGGHAVQADQMRQGMPSLLYDQWKDVAGREWGRNGYVFGDLSRHAWMHLRKGRRQRSHRQR